MIIWWAVAQLQPTLFYYCSLQLLKHSVSSATFYIHNMQKFSDVPYHTGQSLPSQSNLICSLFALLEFQTELSKRIGTLFPYRLNSCTTYIFLCPSFCSRRLRLYGTVHHLHIKSNSTLCKKEKQPVFRFQKELKTWKALPSSESLTPNSGVA